MTKEEILAKLAEFNTVGETRSLTDEEFASVMDLEADLQRAKDTEEFRARHQAYVTPVNQIAAHVAAPKADDTLERAFDHYLRTGEKNADIAELRAQSVGTDSAGGYTVPETLLNRITDRLKAFGGLASVAETITTSTGEPLRWPTLDDTSNKGQIVAENTAPASGGADLVFGEKTLGSHKYVAPGASHLPLKVSVELLQDAAFDVQALVARKLGDRIARAQAYDFVNGSGTNEPNGVINGTAQSATPTYDSLVDAVHSVDIAYRQGSVWVLSDATLASIEKLTDENGRPLLNPAIDGINVGRANALLLGYPVVVDNSFANYAASGTVKWGVFGDISQGYIIRRVSDVQLIVNPYSSANSGQVEYTLWARADGNTQDENAFRVLTGPTS